MSKSSAVIFDLDGTLLDTLDDLADSANEALAEQGLPVHPVDSYRTFVGDGMAVLIARILPEGQNDGTTLQRVLGFYRAAYERRWKNKTRAYHGIVELLDKLTERSVPMAVLSNKPQYFSELCIRHHLPDHTFHPLLGQRDHVPRKPDPAGALEIAHHLNLRPEEILFVGDTKTDMETATAAGMHAVGVTWGFRPLSELLESGARTVINHPLELLQIV